MRGRAATTEGIYTYRRITMRMCAYTWSSSRRIHCSRMCLFTSYESNLRTQVIIVTYLRIVDVHGEPCIRMTPRLLSMGNPRELQVFVRSAKLFVLPSPRLVGVCVSVYKALGKHSLKDYTEVVSFLSFPLRGVLAPAFPSWGHTDSTKLFTH